ncbi:hypothetical protein Aduo_018824 [Ancylostoma duodenale]
MCPRVLIVAVVCPFLTLRLFARSVGGFILRSRDNAERPRARWNIPDFRMDVVLLEEIEKFSLRSHWVAGPPRFLEDEV